MSFRKLSLLLPALCLCCTGPAVDPTGTWERPVADVDLGVHGMEHMTFRDDSTFVLENEMTLQYEDSAFACDLGFHSTVCGRWKPVDMGVRMRYDIGTFFLDTIPGSMRISIRYGEFADSLASALAEDVKTGLSEYYRSVYEPFGTADGLELKELAVCDDVLVAMVNDSVLLRWQRADVR